MFDIDSGCVDFILFSFPSFFLLLNARSFLNKTPKKLLRGVQRLAPTAPRISQFPQSNPYEFLCCR